MIGGSSYDNKNGKNIIPNKAIYNGIFPRVQHFDRLPGSLFEKGNKTLDISYDKYCVYFCSDTILYEDGDE